MTLAEVKKGDKFNITSINDEKTRSQAFRFGISEGAHLFCGDKVPGGPVIIKRNRQEIAIGRNLAKKITIRMG